MSPALASFCCDNVHLSTILSMNALNRVPSGMTGSSADMTLKPEPKLWSLLAQSHPISARQMQFRAQLGLNTDRPIVMTGHQAQIWHPGVLSKYLASGKLATQIQGDSVWLVVDHDTNDPTTIPVPTRREDGSLHRYFWHLDPARVGKSPLMTQPAITPAPYEGPQPANQRIAEGINAITEALNAHRDSTSIAMQFAKACRDLVSDRVEPASIVFASDLARTDLFAELVDRMRDDPEACILAYNQAVRDHPQANLKPLLMNAVQYVYELPLWQLDQDQNRQAVYVEHLEQATELMLMPKALLMTAIVRLGGCELFIHGTGGGIYEQVVDQWLTNWLNSDASPAPYTVASATLVLDLLDGIETDEHDAARAVWQAHAARHRPEMLEDDAAAHAKQYLLDQIAQEPRSSTKRHALYRQMHELLKKTRQTHASSLHDYEKKALRAQRQAENAAIAADRTWAFAFYEKEQLEGLALQLSDALSPNRDLDE